MHPPYRTHQLSPPDPSNREEQASQALQDVAASISQSRFARRGVTVSGDTIRVMLVDDHTILRQGLRGLLRIAPDIQVVAEAANGVAAVSLAAQTTPDVVVMDLDMPDGDGASATRALAQLERRPKVLILTMHTEEERLIPLLEHGATGFLSKDAAENELIDAIRVVASGDVYVRPSVARLLAANLRPHLRKSPIDEAREQLSRLSGRERSVLQLVAEGYSGVEIGRKLGVTPKSVDTYKNRIAEKLGFTHRTDYVRFALRLGLIEIDVMPRSPESANHVGREP